MVSVRKTQKMEVNLGPELRIKQDEIEKLRDENSSLQSNLDQKTARLEEMETRCNAYAD